MVNPEDGGLPGRRAEWFVPEFGPLRFRTFVGLLFLPYTGMVLSFSVIGSLLSEQVAYERVAAIVIIYFLGLGIAAHALDALGSKGTKPWGTVFTKKQLWLLAFLSLIAAYGIAIYYMIRYVPLLAVVAVAEGFFVFAYNLEWFGGRFHTDWWFAFSWGAMPVLAGYIMQTNSISGPAIILSFSMALFSAVEIKASRPYKELKRQVPNLSNDELSLMLRFETLLKCISLGVILLGGGLLIWRLIGQ
ncbi:MAG TPA: UbiA family prenyltransferase [Thermodesulfovibrionales bacterium]|nr:UbiA family prenyltransferase [Thermodesulfovibrionales bacterium]